MALQKGDIVYLAGPMRGKVNQNFHEFQEWARRLRALGLKVLNPAETMGADKLADWKTYISIDIAYIKEAKAIVLIPGWEKSVGAKFEVMLGTTIEKEIFMLKTDPGGDKIIFSPLETVAATVNIMGRSLHAGRCLTTQANLSNEIIVFDDGGDPNATV